MASFICNTCKKILATRSGHRIPASMAIALLEVCGTSLAASESRPDAVSSEPTTQERAPASQPGQVSKITSDDEVPRQARSPVPGLQ